MKVRSFITFRLHSIILSCEVGSPMLLSSLRILAICVRSSSKLISGSAALSDVSSAAKSSRVLSISVSFASISSFEREKSKFLMS